MIKASFITSYDTELNAGIAFMASTTGEETVRPLRLELSAGDVAFMLCGLISRYGETALRSAIASIVRQDPTVKHVVLTKPALILMRGRL